VWWLCASPCLANEGCEKNRVGPQCHAGDGTRRSGAPQQVRVHGTGLEVAVQRHANLGQFVG